MEWVILGLVCVPVIVLVAAFYASRAGQGVEVRPHQVIPTASPRAFVSARAASSAEPNWELVDEAARGFDALVAEHGGKWFYSRVAGVSYPNEDGTSRQKVIRTLTVWQELILERQPEHKLYPYAVRVLVAEGRQIGYVESRAASDVGPSMAAGKQWKAYVAGVGCVPDGGKLGVRIVLLRCGDH